MLVRTPSTPFFCIFCGLADVVDGPSAFLPQVPSSQLTSSGDGGNYRQVNVRRNGAMPMQPLMLPAQPLSSLQLAQVVLQLPPARLVPGIPAPTASPAFLTTKLPEFPHPGKQLTHFRADPHPSC